MKDKEMLYIKQNGDCYIDKDCKWGNMNKEARIKELAKDMGIGFQLSGTTRFGPVAAELVEMGYQRIKEDDMVISRKEYEKLNMKYISTLEQLENKGKETVEKFVYLRKYITNQFHKYHEQRNTVENEYKKCEEEMDKAILNNDWHRCDAIMFILEGIATEFDDIAKQFNVDTKE